METKLNVLLILPILLMGAASLQSCSIAEEIGDSLEEACMQPEFNPTKFEDTNDGICTASDCSLREAVITANACPGDDVINLTPGTYTLNYFETRTDVSAYGTIEITEDVIINGNAAEVEGANISVLGTTTNVSISNVKLRGLNNEGIATVADVTFRSISNRGQFVGTNIDVVDGLGIGNRHGGTLTITNGNVLRNSRAGRLTTRSIAETIRIVINDGGTMILTDVLVADNTMHPEFAGAGYLPVTAIANKNGILELNRVIIMDNNPPLGGVGRGVSSHGDISTRALLNEVLISGHNGFAVVAAFSPLEIIDSTIRDNPGGALFIDAHSEVTIRRSLLAGNGTNDFLSSACGSIYNSGTNLIIENSTLSGNSDSGTGCAVIENLTNLRLVSSTLFDNALPVVFDQESWSPTVRIEGSIIANNTGGNCVSSVATSLGHNLFDDGSCSPDSTVGDVVDTSSLFGILPLADNGGPTWTHALEGDSPAVDSAGDSCLSTDQRSVSRPLDGDGDGVPACDIGAFELDPEGTGMTTSPGSDDPTPVPAATPEPSTPIPPEPITVNFNADAYSIVSGECTRLRWDVKNAEVVTLESQPVLPLEAEQVCPPSTKTYKMVASNSSEEVERFVTIEVSTPVVPPKAPAQLNIVNQVCTGQTYAVTLGWIDAADNEDGYRVYRDGNLITTLGPNAKGFTDNPPYGGPYTYGVEAFNDAGASSRPTVQEAGCIT